METASQGDDEGPFGIGKDLEVDHLVADAIERTDGLGHRVNPAPGEYAPVGTEDGVELLVQKQVLFPLVQDPVIRPQPHQFSVGASSLWHRLWMVQMRIPERSPVSPQACADVMKRCCSLPAASLPAYGPLLVINFR